MITVKFKMLSDKAVAPFRGSADAAGWDLTAVSQEWDRKTCTTCYGTGIAVEIPKGHVGLLFPRSSIYRKGQMHTNAVGVIDSDYRGEIFMRFSNREDCPAEYREGERIGQLIIMPIPQVDWVACGELSETARGTGGYGSTGA